MVFEYFKDKVIINGIEHSYKFKYRLTNRIEIILYKMNVLKDVMIAVTTQHINLVRLYNEKRISKEYLLEQLDKGIVISQDIKKELDLLAIEESVAISNRLMLKNRKDKGYFKREVNGVKIRTLRQLTIDLYDKLLPRVCLKCGSNQKLTIHHLRYKYPIELKDLVRLCRSCHSKLHKNTLTPLLHMEIQND